MKVAIVTDSNSGITQEEAKKMGVVVVPMPFLISGVEYFEDINLSQAEFFIKLKTEDKISTSQPAIGAKIDLWNNLLKEYDQIVEIPMSSGLSQTCETAKKFSEDFNGKVEIADNHRISITQKQSVYDALKLAKEGKNAKEIKEYLEKTAAQSSIYIMVDTLKYLKRGGRVTPAAAAIGTLLNIKPVLQIQGGKLDQFTKVINIKTAKIKMLEAVKKDLETRFNDLLTLGKMGISIAHTNNYACAEQFGKEANEFFKEFNIKVDFVDPLSLSVACHIGDGSLAIGCYVKY